MTDTVSLYSPAFVGTYCAYPRWDGQVELTWAAGYIPGDVYPLLVTTPNIISVQQRATMPAFFCVTAIQNRTLLSLRNSLVIITSAKDVM